MAGVRRDKQWAGQRRPWLWIGSCVAVWLLSCGVAWVAVRASGASRLEAELELLRSAGKPIRPSDYPAGPAPADAESAAVWVASLEELASSAEQQPAGIAMLGGSTPLLSAIHGGMRGTVSAPTGTTPATPPPELAAAPECAAVVERLGTDPERLAEWLDSIADDPLALQADAACAALALHARAEAGGLLETASRACSLEPASTGTWFAELERDDEPMVSRQVLGVLNAVEALTDEALARALLREQDAALAALDAALCACDVLAPLHSRGLYEAWRSCEIRALIGASRCLSFLDAVQDRSRLDAHLAQLDARARCLESLDGERALICRMYERYRSGRSTGIHPIDTEDFRPMSGLASPMLLHEQADVLAFCRAREEWLSRPPHSAGPPPRRESSLAASAVLSDWLDLERHGDDHPWGEVEARAALLRVARVARREGLSAALAAAAAQQDPFSGSPLKTRVEPEGTLVIWSVGADGHDDGGAPRSAALGPTADLWTRVLAR